MTDKLERMELDLEFKDKVNNWTSLTLSTFKRRPFFHQFLRAKN